jgi:hypothetical protein
MDDHLLTFGDVHYLLALAAGGRTDEAQRFTESLSRYAARHDESEAAVAGDPGLALSVAILARQRGDHAAASRELAAVRDNIWRIGGSHAQRDLFEEMLIDSALRAGEVGKARSLLEQRLIHRRAVPGAGSTSPRLWIKSATNPPPQPRGTRQRPFGRSPDVRFLWSPGRHRAYRTKALYCSTAERMLAIVRRRNRSASAASPARKAATTAR